MQPIIEPAVSSHSQTEAQSVSAWRRPRKRLRVIGWAALALLLLIVIPPLININYFRRSIIRSISDGLGRPVHARSVKLALFPRPAFILQNLTIDEDLAYGAEPVMMDASVTATLRASTLWHRRVEIATLNFDSPSVNLARNVQGHWNFEPLLHNSPALHANVGGGAVPSHFPYIEATEARINFKLGAEKLPFSLENADLSLWKASGGEWHVRLRARPVRTDMTVADAGQIRGEAVLKSAGDLNRSTLQAHFDWRQVELGEIGRLLQGRDNSWRGIVDWSVQAQGTLAELPIASTIVIDSFHRAEFIPQTEMDLTAQCGFHFGPAYRIFETLHCAIPSGSGQIVLRGIGATGMGQPAFARIVLRQAPAQFFLDVLRHVHPGIAEDARIAGNLAGSINCGIPGFNGLDTCTGQVQSPGLIFHIPDAEHPLKISPVLLANFSVATPSRAPERKFTESTPAQAATNSDWVLSPTHVSLGASNPATLTGSLNSTGADISVSGPADLSRLAGLARGLHVSAALSEAQSIHGSAQIALSLSSKWLPQSAPSPESLGEPIVQFAPSLWAGSLKISDATFKTVFLPAKLHLASGHLEFSPSGVEWTHLDGTIAHTAFDGSVRWQTPCAGRNADCGRSFQLHFPNLNLGRMETALHQGSSSLDLLRALNPWSSVPEMPLSSGTIDAGAVAAGHLLLKDVVLQVQVQGHSAQLLGFSASVFGGTLSAGSMEAATTSSAINRTGDNSTGSIRWGDGPPSYQLRLHFSEIQPNRVAAIWRERWGGGLASGRMDVNTSGWTEPELAEHASGKFNLAWKNGGLARAAAATTADDSRFAKFQRWEAEGTIQNERLTLHRSKIEFKRTLPAQSATGTITFGRILDLHFQPSGDSLTGPLQLPLANPQAKRAIIARE